MSALPPIADFTAGSVSEGGFKTALTALRAYLATLLGASGDQGPALAAIGAPYNKVVTKTGAYTVIATDRGSHLDLSGTFTLSLTAANTLGDGFAFSVRNSGSGAISVDPSGGETLDGSTLVSLGPGQSLVILCDGASFRSVGKTAPAGALLNVQVFTSTGTYTASSGVSRILVEALGPGAQGGLGGAAPGMALYGAQGRGGQMGARRKLFTTNIASQTVTIGASGGTTSFGSLLTAGQGTTGTGGFTDIPGPLSHTSYGSGSTVDGVGAANTGAGGYGGPGGYGGAAPYGIGVYGPSMGDAGGTGLVIVYEFA